MSAPTRRMHLSDDEVSHVRALGAVGTAKRLVEYVDMLIGRHCGDERDAILRWSTRRRQRVHCLEESSEFMRGYVAAHEDLEVTLRQRGQR